MTWREELHPRDPDGEFTDRAGWIEKVSQTLSGGLHAAIASGVDDEFTLTGGHSGAFVSLVTHRNGTKTIRKGFGTVDNWQGLSPERQADAEELASALGRAIGAPVAEVIRTAPNEVYVQLLPGESGYAEIARRTNGDWKQFTADVKKNATPAELRLGLFDLLTENHDRSNPANWVTDEHGQPHGFDHAGVFRRYENSERSPELPDLMGAPGPFAAPYVMGFEDPKWKTNPLTQADVARLRAGVDSVRARFALAGRSDWWDAMSTRLDAIGAKARGKVDIFPGDGHGVA